MLPSKKMLKAAAVKACKQCGSAPRNVSHAFIEPQRCQETVLMHKLDKDAIVMNK